MPRGIPKGPRPSGYKSRRNPLKSQEGIVAEMARLYRLARRGKLDPHEARSHIWCLEKIGQRLDAITMDRIERRLAEMSGNAAVAASEDLASEKTNGAYSDNRPLLIEHDGGEVLN